MKYIVVTGGVISGLGKGITISSIGRILKASGIRITAIKIDPYLNTDAGTMSPFEHGETFVLDDGGETDLDLGNYERFLDLTLTARHNITTGKIYKEVIERERRGDYLGKTVQLIPHGTDAIIQWIREVAEICTDGSGLTPEICLIELGGTVGDIESMLFIEALRQFQFITKEQMAFIHVSLVPILGADAEQKTKPTQHSIKELRSLGISPDMIICRSKEPLHETTVQKLSIFCQVEASHILTIHDVSNIYHVPLLLARQNIHLLLQHKFNLATVTPDLASWTELAHTVDQLESKPQHKIVIVGKYTGLQDSYLSVLKSVKHSAILLQANVNITWVEASDLEQETKQTNLAAYSKAWELLRSAAGILVPGGFGNRGIEGKIAAAQYARENKVPYLGLCLGMQVMVIEYARHVLNVANANSIEFDEACEAVVVFMPEINPLVMGGTMRLGARATSIAAKLPNGETSTASRIYALEQNGDVLERHRHRYEVNPEYIERIQNAGLYFSGVDDRNERMEIAELPQSQHPYYLGSQYHPELKSRPGRPSPPVFGLIATAIGQADKISQAGQLWQAHESKLKTARNTSSPVKASSCTSVLSPATSALGKRRARSMSNGMDSVKLQLE